MNSLLLWLRGVLRWILEPRLFWIAIAVVLLAVTFALRRGTDEAVIRFVGMALQLLGIGTVVWGIRETRAFFGRPSLFALGKRWFSQFPPLKTRIVHAKGNATLGQVTGTGRGHALSVVAPDAPLDERVRALEANLNQVIKRFDLIANETDEELRKVRETLNQEARTRASEDDQLHHKLEATETGGLHISAMGALWLFVGVIFGSIPAELAKWFG